MQTVKITTPFGRRPMSLALVKGQLQSATDQPVRTIEKWKVFRDIAEARQLLGLQDRALAVLNALLTFYPGNELAAGGSLIVFPSNAQLSLRAHGIAGTTLRRQLGALVDAGLIHRRDSPNGKRYAHRDRTGEIEEAFGFDLKPLLVRAGELAGMAQKVAEEARLFKRAREALTLCRRDVRKLITAALEEGAEGDWARIESLYIAQVGRLSRAPSRTEVIAALEDMSLLRDEVVNLLELQLETKNMDGNDSQDGDHIQNSKPDSIHELEPSSRKEQGRVTETASTPMPAIGTQKPFPLGMVVRACPQIGDYGPAGTISSWHDLMGAAVIVRSTLGVSPSAYQEACEVLGPENAAVTIACILERAGHINSAGGYLRDLTVRAKRGKFSLGPMLMALLRLNAGIGVAASG
ncbi:plasmid replication protein RepC [Agrobacterium vitis]|uniref:plasmid replication protein RepC n=1 Tax=Agrobacterium vitis TaxID=373 RepID=UPI003D2656A2